MKKTQEQTFLQVKERLDYYRLPTIFPYEAVDLLSQLLSLLDKYVRKEGKENYQSNKHQQQNELNDALRLQIGKVVKQNNKLHMDLITAKEEILALKHNNDKLLIERSGGSKQMVVLLQAQRKREDELFEELTQVKFKYNQLMDLVHEDSQIEKKYIKRLMKHKKMQINYKNQQNSQQKVFKKGPHQTVTEIEAKMILLQNKLANRQAEILRLQKKSQYDGLNMNKILKDFHNHRTDNKISALEQQINYLEEENKKMKDQVKFCKGNGGSKQALRQQMKKNHQLIKKLSSQNKQLKREVEKKQFDGKAKQKQGKRQLQKINQKAQENAQEAELSRLAILDFKKKIQFLKGQLQTAKIALQKEQKLSSQKEVLINKIKNSEEGDKILSQYEIQSLKQRVQQLQGQIETYSQKINVLKAENQYHKKEDQLKNLAIENLEKIVDELMKRNNEKIGGDAYLTETQSVNLENTIALRKNLAEMKQSLASSQNQKQKIQRQFQTLAIRFQQKSMENNALNDELNRLKIRVLEMKHTQQQFLTMQRQIATLQSDLKKQQNFRFKIDQMHQQAENDKARLRKQLQQLTQQYQIYERKSKSNMNSLKMQLNQFEESNQMLDLMLKQKDKKIILLDSQLEQVQGKIKILKEEIKNLEEDNHVAVRQKHKYQKRCQQMLKLKQETASSHIKSYDFQNKQLHNHILEYQADIKKLRERISAQNEQIMQLNSYCDALKIDQDNLIQQKAFLKVQNERLKGVRQEAPIVDGQK